MMRSYAQRGFTLLELMLASTVGLLIMSAAFTLYKKGQADQATKDTYEIIRTILDDAQSITAHRSDMQVEGPGGALRGLNIDDLITAKGGIEEFPRGTYVVGPGVIAHPMGGEIEVRSATSTGSPEPDLVEVELRNVPRGSCPLMLSRAVSANVYDMYVNNQLVALTPEADANSIGRSDVRMDQAVDLCSAGGRYVTIRIRQLKEIHYAQMRASPFGASMTAQETATLGPLYTRQENALAARETAQLAIP